MRNRRQRRRADAKQATTPFFQKKGRESDEPAAGKGAFFQTKLTLGQPGDRFEREADRTADAVVNRISAGGKDKAAVDSKGTLRRKGEQEENLQAKGQLQRQADEEAESVQSQAEEEEAVQSQAEEEEAVQSQAEEEEAVQSQAEEEEAVQSQAEEEEAVQAQAEEEEAVQSQAEEEEAVQAQAEEEQEPVQTRLENEPVQSKTEHPGRPKPIARSGSESMGGEKRRPGPAFAAMLKQRLGRGRPLPPRLRAEMEAAFGADFGAVRIHTDETAAQLSRMLGAQAFTRGNDIFFNKGRFDPDTTAGKRLLAHELTHTRQQGS